MTELLTTKAAAKLLGVSKEGIRYYVRTKQLPRNQVGNQFLFSKECILRFLEERVRKA